MSTDIEAQVDEFQKLIQEQLADRKAKQEQFAEQVKANHAHMEAMRDEIAQQIHKRPNTTGQVATPELGELSLLLNRMPQITPAVLKYAKGLVSRIEAAVNAELTKEL